MNIIGKLLRHNPFVPKEVEDRFDAAPDSPERTLVSRRGRTLVTLLLLMVMETSIHPVSLDLKITSMDGSTLKEAGAGQPFMAYVTVNEAHNVTTRPTLNHSNDAFVRANGYQMNMINGNTTVVYQFQIRIDTPGIFTIGPAHLTHESCTIESNTLSVTVNQEQKVDQLKKASAPSSSNFFRLTTDKQRAYVGEKITAQLTFYTNDSNVSLQAIYDPEQLEKTGFRSKPRSEPIHGITKIDGNEYRYAQWEFETYATKSGNLTFPAYAVDFMCQANRGMFAMLFAHHDVKRLYSNTLTLSIDPLPAGKREPLFVGIISQFNAKITPAHTQVAKGMILALSITGHGDFDTMPFIPLNMIDTTFKWYESKQYTQPGKDGEKTHIIEYVIQATQPGTFSIHNQELFYFDTKERTYKLIKTLEIPVHITPGIIAPFTAPSSNASNQEQLPESASSFIICKEYAPQSSYCIPWFYYWMSILALAGAALVWHLYPFVSHLKITGAPYSTKQIKKKIKQVAHLHNYQSLYPLFATYCAQQSRKKMEEITEDDISNWLLQSGFNAQLLHDWKQFFQELAQLRFGKTSNDNHQALIKRSLYWLDILDKLPRGNQ